MTTAHRPTWAPAKGGEEQGGTRMYVASRAYSSKSQAAHTKLKFRQDGQASAKDVQKRDLRTELEERERKAKKSNLNISFEEERKKDLLLLEQSADAGGGGRVKALVPKAIDADESDPDDSDDSDDSDEEDEEAELLRELERIKKEREEEAAKKAAEEAAVQEKEREQELIRGNPLMQSEASFTVKRRWDEDVVFRNQTRGKPKEQKRFINDTIRNDFHRRFLDRYIK